MTNDEKREFYSKCGEILGIEHDWKEPVKKRNRWNTRFIGNGRFPGYGLIRVYGDQIMVISRAGSKMYQSVDDVYGLLKQNGPVA